MEFPLSALAIMALFFCSLFLIEVTSLVSGCGVMCWLRVVMCVCGLPLFSCMPLSLTCG